LYICGSKVLGLAPCATVTILSSVGVVAFSKSPCDKNIGSHCNLQ